MTAQNETRNTNAHVTLRDDTEIVSANKIRYDGALGIEIPVVSDETGPLYALVEPCGHSAVVRVIFSYPSYAHPSGAYEAAIEALGEVLDEADAPHVTAEEIQEYWPEYDCERGDCLPEGYHYVDGGRIVEIDPGWQLCPVTREWLEAWEIALKIEATE